MTTTDEQAKAARKAELKALALRKQQAETEKAEYESLEAGIDLKQKLREEDYAEAMGVARGVFTLIGPVDERSVSSWRTAILQYARINPGDDLRVILSSPGGSVFDGWFLFDTLRQLSAQGHRIITEASGMAASMAGIILQAGDHRVIGAESYLMLHEVSAGAIGKGFELKDKAELVDRLTKQACNVFARRSHLSSTEIYDMFVRRDLWLNAEESLAYGFVDEIVGRSPEPTLKAVAA